MSVSSRFEDQDQARQAQRDRARAWLDAHWEGNRQCPICRSENWVIGDPVDMRLYSGGGLNLLAGTRVMCPVTCDTCYYTWQFDAVESGVLDAQPDVPSESGTAHR